MSNEVEKKVIVGKFNVVYHSKDAVVDRKSNGRSQRVFWLAPKFHATWSGMEHGLGKSLIRNGFVPLAEASSQPDQPYIAFGRTTNKRGFERSSEVVLFRGPKAANAAVEAKSKKP